jgi:hypothetical protein
MGDWYFWLGDGRRWLFPCTLCPSRRTPTHKSHPSSSEKKKKNTNNDKVVSHSTPKVLCRCCISCHHKFVNWQRSQTRHSTLSPTANDSYWHLVAFHKLAPSCHNYVKDCHKLDFCLSLCLYNIAVTLYSLSFLHRYLFRLSMTFSSLTRFTNCHKLANFRLSDQNIVTENFTNSSFTPIPTPSFFVLFFRWRWRLKIIKVLQNVWLAKMRYTRVHGTLLNSKFE